MAVPKYEQTAIARDVVLTFRGAGFTELQYTLDNLRAKPRWTFQVKGCVQIGDAFIAVLDVSYRAKKANRDDIRKRLDEWLGRGVANVPPRSSEIVEKVQYATTR